MFQSQLLCKTKKEAPKDAQIISHQLLVRGDFIEQSFSGVYRLLPLGFRVYKKIEEIIRREMLDLEAQEIYLPALQNKSLWMETNRWSTIDPPLFKLKDRHQKETALGSTHEEEITDIARKRIKSWQDLPFSIFQIQNKFRNEIRASGGLLRTKEFVMKDLYSFHSAEKDLDRFYKKVQKAYLKIFKNCGLGKIAIVKAVGGTIGGKKTDEFMVISPVGEDKIAICQKCHFAANIEAIQQNRICPSCKGNLKLFPSIEIGHTFNLGTKYSETMGAKFADKDGKLKPIIMGCYGVGLGRLLATIVEVNHDEKGIIWPKEVAPFLCHLIPIEHTGKVKKITEQIQDDLEREKLKEPRSFHASAKASAIDVLYDDRDKSAGEKFADADLIGIPIRIVVSSKTLEKDSVEVKKRNETKTQLIKIKSLGKFLKDYV